MKWVIQRVHHASVKVENEVVGSINQGLLILMGITHTDTMEDAQWLVRKTLGMRIFSDDQGKMNHGLGETNGGILLVSQFTLHALTAKGNRPSFMLAAKPEIAEKLYQKTLTLLTQEFQGPVSSGKFGADMQITSLLDGPVTIIIDSHNRI
jgi:D-tyrosyl-tRNA(Tyr) deacylase